MPPTVAIIMRAKNEMPHVQRTLEMLQRQTFHGFDLFAVDSGSTDGTLEALEESCPKERLAQISPDNYVPGKVLNEAIARTDHDIIVLLNADAIPLSNDFLANLLRPFAANETDAVFARQAARSDARFVVAYDYLRGYNGDRMEPSFFSAVACAFRHTLWEQVHFRETGYAEDLAWAKACIAEGARFQLATDAAVEHSHNYTLKELYRKRYRQAATFNQKASIWRQGYLCMREVARDFFHACRTLKLQTIPYNMAYRVTIHAAVHRGLKDALDRQPVSLP